MRCTTYCELTAISLHIYLLFCLLCGMIIKLSTLSGGKEVALWKFLLPSFSPYWQVQRQTTYASGWTEMMTAPTHRFVPVKRQKTRKRQLPSFCFFDFVANLLPSAYNHYIPRGVFCQQFLSTFFFHDVFGCFCKTYVFMVTPNPPDVVTDLFFTNYYLYGNM